MKKKFILVSSSIRRRELFGKLGLKFKVFKVKTREIKKSKLPPQEIAILNAKGKVKAARNKFKKGILIAADTLIYFKGKILGKPKNFKEAKIMLKMLSGHRHKVFTGLAVLNLNNRQLITDYEESKVTFKKLTDKKINKYLEVVNPLDKAAAYALQEKGKWLIKKVVGPRDNVIGLPVKKLIRIFSRIS